MVNVNKLRGKIVECDMNVEEVAKKVGINKTTLYRKLNSGGDNFTLSEVKKIGEVLSLTYNELEIIFFE